MKFSDFAESTLKPLAGEYQARKFEQFLKETKNAECPGCGQCGLYEYIILDYERGIMQCPQCPQRTNLKTMMRSWITLDIMDSESSKH